MSTDKGLKDMLLPSKGFEACPKWSEGTKDSSEKTVTDFTLYTQLALEFLS